MTELAAPLGTRVRPAVYDGDTPVEEREWVRQYANYVLTNPDMLHRGILPAHPRWSSFLRSLRYVVIDECHTYRGVFGSHVAQVLRRLRRVCARYGADPVFLLASATAAEPAVAAGAPHRPARRRGRPTTPHRAASWSSPCGSRRSPSCTARSGAPVRRTATAETADLLTDLAVQGVRTVAFVRSRRGAELISLIAQERLAEVDRSLPARVAAYRGGYLPEERRALERALHSGDLLGLAATTALELGVDVSGLDAVLIAGYPGTRASAVAAGRAAPAARGRARSPSSSPATTRWTPTSSTTPRRSSGSPVESTVLDPDNPYVLAPHLCAAAAELPLTEADLGTLRARRRGSAAAAGGRKLLRRRAGGLVLDPPGARRRPRRHPRRGRHARPDRRGRTRAGCWARSTPGRPHHRPRRAPSTCTRAARTWSRHLDLEDSVALVEEANPPVLDHRPRHHGRSPSSRRTPRCRGATARLCFGSVEVTNQVVSFLRRRLITGEVLGETKLDLPPRTLRTRAVWWTVTEDQLDAARIDPEILGGALHAAEHASIGLLPLFATCDRWDIGGVSIAAAPRHAPAHGLRLRRPPGRRGLRRARLPHRRAPGSPPPARPSPPASARRGCPSCIQSPKCGNGNDPLHKRGAVRLLTQLLTSAS